MSAAVLLKLLEKKRKIINRKTELCHHRPQTNAHNNEYENNTHKAEQSLPVWRAAGGSNRGTRPLLSSSDGARSCRNTLRCLLLYCSSQTEIKNKEKSSTEKQSSAIIVHKPKRTATSTGTIHTRQNKLYRLGAAPAGVIGPRGRCCPAATFPVAVVFACGVRCCIAEIAKNKQNKIINRKTEICHHRSQPKAHSNEYENNTHKAEQSLPAWRGDGRSRRGTKPLLSSSDGARSCRIRLRCLLLYC